MCVLIFLLYFFFILAVLKINICPQKDISKNEFSFSFVLPFLKKVVWANIIFCYSYPLKLSKTPDFQNSAGKATGKTPNSIYS